MSKSTDWCRAEAVFMRWRQILILRLRTLFAPRLLEEELDEELRYHLEREIEKHMYAGLNTQEARYAALRSMGATEQRKEECRDSRGVRWLQDMLLDFKYSVRSLSNVPNFTLIAIFVLALAIGANTAVFTVVNGVLLRPLPFREPDRLFLVSEVPKGIFFDPGPIMIDRDYLAFRKHNHSFENLASGAGGIKMTLTGGGDPATVTASVVGTDFLRVLEVKPSIGSDFQLQGQPDRAVLLSHKLWESRFGGDSKAVGQIIALNGVAYTIAGIMPDTFTFQNADLWVRDELQIDPHNVFFVPVMGRLKPGISPQQAQAELAIFAEHTVVDSGFNGRGWVTRILPLKDLFVASVRKLLLIFMGAVGFVFLVSCANFANLLLIRGSGRQPEIAVRAALGASRWRLVRQLLMESTLLSVSGATLGVLLSVAGVRTLMAILPADNIPPGSDLNPEMRVLLFALILALVVGVCFGLAPALGATRRALREGVTEGGRNRLVRRERLRGFLVVIELASALILLSGAGLLVKSFLQMRAVNPGFRATNLVVTTVDLPEARYRTTAQMQAFDQRVLTDLAALPGVNSAAAVSFLPFGRGVMGDFHLADGRHLPDGYTVDKPEISAGYFRAMGIHILNGREFNEKDILGSPEVAVVSDSVARRFWPAGNAIGQRISMEDHPQPGDWLTIVGVAGDVRQGGLRDRAAPVIYQPYRQIKMPGFINHISFIVQSTSLAAVAAGMRTVIHNADKELPVDSVTTMDSIVAASMMGARSQTRLLTIFSILALLLAAIGIYGVLACSVAERTHEIGIRMAVGAGRNDIVWMVIRRTLVLTATGAMAGLAGALALTHELTKLLFELTPTDPGTFFAVTGILAAVAVISSLMPARRAAKVHPLEALRHE
jgi:predicted permease